MIYSKWLSKTNALFLKRYVLCQRFFFIILSNFCRNTVFTSFPCPLSPFKGYFFFHSAILMTSIATETMHIMFKFILVRHSNMQPSAKLEPAQSNILYMIEYQPSCIHMNSKPEEFTVIFTIKFSLTVLLRSYFHLKFTGTKTL